MAGQMNSLQLAAPNGSFIGVLVHSEPKLGLWSGGDEAGARKCKGSDKTLAFTHGSELRDMGGASALTLKFRPPHNFSGPLTFKAMVFYGSIRRFAFGEATI